MCWSSTKWTSSSYHSKLTCSRHDIAEKLNCSRHDIAEKLTCSRHDIAEKLLSCH